MKNVFVYFTDFLFSKHEIPNKCDHAFRVGHACLYCSSNRGVLGIH